VLGFGLAFLRARKTDKTTDSRIADNFTYLTPKKEAARVLAALQKGAELENQETFLPPGVLHPHECCTNAATKKVPFPSVNRGFGTLQRVQDTRERLIADKKGPEARESPHTVEEKPQRERAPADCLRRSGGRAEGLVTQGIGPELPLIGFLGSSPAKLSGPG
jgi:hypothetical protein